LKSVLKREKYAVVFPFPT